MAEACAGWLYDEVAEVGSAEVEDGEHEEDEEEEEAHEPEEVEELAGEAEAGMANTPCGCGFGLPIRFR